MRRFILAITVVAASLTLGGCGVYTASCGSTCVRPTTTYVTTSCCATCNPCYGYGYGWY